MKIRPMYIILAVVTLVVLVVGTFYLLTSFDTDSRHVYTIENGEVIYTAYGERAVLPADAKSFTIICDSKYPDCKRAKDKTHVFYAGLTLPGADPNTFEVFKKNGDYSRDRDHVFYAGWLVEDADVGSFEVMSNYSPGVGKDKKHVFIGYETYKEADSQTFVLLFDPSGTGTPYAKDKNHVFYFLDVYLDMPKVLVGADPTTFQPLSSTYFFPSFDWSFYLHYAKDSRHVYSENKIIQEADPSTFEVIKTPDGEYSAYGEDAQHVFDLTSGKILDVDRGTFTVLSSKKAKDKNRTLSSPPSWN